MVTFIQNTRNGKSFYNLIMIQSLSLILNPYHCFLFINLLNLKAQYLTLTVYNKPNNLGLERLCETSI